MDMDIALDVRIAELGGEMVRSMREGDASTNRCVVLWRDSRGTYVTHRWWADSAGAHLMWGHYDLTLEEGEKDFHARASRFTVGG